MRSLNYLRSVHFERRFDFCPDNSPFEKLDHPNVSSKLIINKLSGIRENDINNIRRQCSLHQWNHS